MPEAFPQNVTLRPGKRRRLIPTFPPSPPSPTSPHPQTSPSPPLPPPPPSPSTPAERKAYYLTTQPPHIRHIIAKHLHAFSLTLTEAREKEQLSNGYFELMQIANGGLERSTSTNVSGQVDGQMPTCMMSEPET
ncbi:hypothetical protein B9Z19DRAFT_1064893 [Tuber borchii]|uniref:Uncharacterized protein n=1 Tax=Tuber borchii TaxID=42251 RepID=A0A2T6ZSW1_TUBBO|nr:hypothetical protein B9Z19DRAFT_1064893 [Tuber borchii]